MLTSLSHIQSTRAFKAREVISIPQRQFLDPYSEKTKFYINVFVDPQVQVWLEKNIWADIIFLTNCHKKGCLSGVLLDSDPIP